MHTYIRKKCPHTQSASNLKKTCPNTSSHLISSHSTHRLFPPPKHATFCSHQFPLRNCAEKQAIRIFQSFGMNELATRKMNDTYEADRETRTGKPRKLARKMVEIRQSLASWAWMDVFLGQKKGDKMVARNLVGDMNERKDWDTFQAHGE